MSGRKKGHKTGKRTAQPGVGGGAGAKRVYVPPSHTSAQRICWQFGALDLEGPYGWGRINRKQMLRVIEFVRDVEKRPMQDVFDGATNRASAGCAKAIPLEDICPEARGRLRKLGFDDHDRIWELRLGRKPRLWCLRFEQVVCVLWWDPMHKVCP